MLAVLDRQIELYDAQIRALYLQHPDKDIFDSLPGAGDQAGPQTPRGVRSRSLALYQCSVFTVLCRDGSGDLSIRENA